MPETARLLQKFFLIYFLTITHTILYSQKEVSPKNIVNDDLSEEIVEGGAGDKEARFGRISGKVTDRETGQPLIGTNIVVLGKALGAATNVEGQYTIEQLRPGEYILNSHILDTRRKKLIKSIFL